MTPTKFTSASALIALKGKQAIVTGGARGIGYAICYRLAEAGAAVVMADIDDKETEKACQKLAEAGYQAIPVHCDVSSEDEVKAMVSGTVSKVGGVDILVNNAGIFPMIPLAEMTSADIDKVLAVNLRSIFLCSREASQRMVEQKRGGCIINIASMDAVHPATKGFSVYDASKGGVLSMTKSLALELGPHEIRVNAIAPGAILTEGATTAMKGSFTGMNRAMLKTFMARMALGRMGNADDIARVALFLASDLASYVTGTCIFADGGYLIS